jgi:hypothetical protein
MFIIEHGSYVVCDYEPGMVIMTEHKNYYKRFRTEKTANKFIDKYSDCGYGLVGSLCKIVKL